MMIRMMLKSKKKKKKRRKDKLQNHKTVFNFNNFSYEAMKLYKEHMEMSPVSHVFPLEK